MAKVIHEDRRVIPQSEWQVWLRVVLFGAVVGFVYWLTYLLITKYITVPLMCGGAASCDQSAIIASKIATVIVAVGALFGMIKLSVVRPLAIAVGSAVVLWPLGEWALGLFWLESLGWAIVVYALSYALFSWIARYHSTVISMATAAIVAIVLRIALMLI